MNMLRLEHIDAGYDRRNVLQDLSLEVEADKIVVLIGPNGAGKSTVLRVVAGFLEPRRGKVWLKEKDITGLAPHRRIDRALAYCIQGGRVFPSLSVAENLDMGAGGLPAEKREQGREAVLNLFPNLKPLLARRAGVLSGGERQALALGMVLVRHPDLLLLDEPSAGLSPRLVQDLLDRVRRLNQEWGLTILLVEQNVRAALRVSDRALAQVKGEVVRTTDQPEEWLEEQSLKDVFFGQSIT